MKLNILTARTDREFHTFEGKFLPDPSYFDNFSYEDVRVSGTYRMEPDSDDVILSYRLRFSLRGVCDSCGDPAGFEGEIEGTECVKKVLGEESPAGVKIDEGDDSYRYEGDEIELDRMFNEALLLHAPSRLVCREDCRGLCPKCGKNLNEGGCDCAEDYSDSPFAKLLNLKK